MVTFLYIVLAVLMFGTFIFIHEFGHYFFARLFKVSITEFSIGMGKKILSKTSQKTGIKYSLGILPIGGYVAMVGENEDSDDPNALSKKPAWQRFIIVIAGAVVNLIFGIILMLWLVAMTSSNGIYTNQVSAFHETDTAISSSQYGLQVGDTIIEIDGKRTYNAYDVSYEIMRKGVEPVDITVLRSGEEILLENVQFPIDSTDGVALGRIDFYITAKEATFGGIIAHTVQRSAMTVRMVWESLYDLITGRYGIQAVSGPVGITETIVEVTDDAVESRDYSSLLYIASIICINLGVMNLLPLPALDGGRLFFILIEIIFRRPVPSKIENAIHATGMYLLLLFMLFISLKDVWTLIF